MEYDNGFSLTSNIMFFKGFCPFLAAVVLRILVQVLLFSFYFSVSSKVTYEEGHLCIVMNSGLEITRLFSLC
jgi:hypothetical protein